MAHSHQIFNELRQISELVANLPDKSPYQAPAGYFENLSNDVMNYIKTLEQPDADLSISKEKLTTPYNIPGGYFDDLSNNILQRIKLLETSPDNEELELLSPLLFQVKKGLPYSVPDSYFEELPGNILHRISLRETFSDEDELEVLSPVLSKLSKELPYQAPSGYFDDLAGKMLQHINSQESSAENEEPELSPMLLGLKKSIPYSLPEGYFDEFPSDIIAGVNAIEYVNQELEVHAPVLNDLKIKNAYEVPEGYFETLGEKILHKVKKQQKAAVISISFNKRILRYSVAALLAGVMSITAWMLFQNKSVGNSDKGLADIKKISNDEMKAYLENIPDSPGDSTSTVYFTMKDEDIPELLTDFPDEELQQYLDQHAEVKDLIIN